MKKAKAFVNPTTGQAVVEDPNGKMYFLDYSKPGKPEPTNKSHAFKMLNPTGSAEIEPCEVGEYPYKKFYDFLDFSFKSNLARVLFCSVMDSTLKPKTVMLAVNALKKILEDSEIYSFLEELFLKVSLPEKADLTLVERTGKIGELLNKVEEKWRKNK